MKIGAIFLLRNSHAFGIVSISPQSKLTLAYRDLLGQCSRRTLTNLHLMENEKI